MMGGKTEVSEGEVSAPPKLVIPVEQNKKEVTGRTQWR